MLTLVNLPDGSQAVCRERKGVDVHTHHVHEPKKDENFSPKKSKKLVVIVGKFHRMKDRFGKIF